MTGKTLKTIVFVGVLTLGVGAGQAMAQTQADFQVSANVISSCRISAANLAFGDYNPLTPGAINGQSDITIRCTKGTTTYIALQGVTALTNGLNSLAYQLYQDSTRTTVWGATGAARREWTAPSNGNATLTVYGRLAGTEDVPVGLYTDTVTAAIEF